MPRGFEGVRAASDDIAARKAAGGSFSSRLFFTLDDGESAVVRFLEEGDEVNFAWKHKTPPTGDRKWGGWVVCRDQDETGAPVGADCPGCDRDLKKQFRGVINMVWRDAPVYERDKEGRLVKDRYDRKIVTDQKDQ